MMYITAYQRLAISEPLPFLCSFISPQLQSASSFPASIPFQLHPGPHLDKAPLGKDLAD